MAQEIERKFLLLSEEWRKYAAPGIRLKQGYLSNGAAEATVRIRIAGERAFLTVKSQASGLVRAEFEYPVPLTDAETMLDTLTSGHAVEKIRYSLPAGNGLVWEIDEYLGENSGLFTAEIELPAEDTPFDRPEWLGAEITGDFRYANSALSVKPFSTWREKNA
ncbi:MAG: CYTH domain-containing protein [Lentisphaeria bacterium]|nr:CYTH domain-containing protein [Lentisphaeria bacterium]